MLTLFIEGGVPMLAVLAFGIAALVGAVRFAMRPDPRRVNSIIAMSLAVLGSTLLGVFADIAAVGHAVNQHFAEASNHDVMLVTYQGIAECMSPLIFGFGMLTVVAMLMAVGYRRLVARLPAV